MNDSRPPEPGPPARRRAARRCVPAVLRGDLVPDGLRLPGQRASRSSATRSASPSWRGRYRYIEVLDPRLRGPVAGPPCFLDDDLFEFNDLHGDPREHLPRPADLPRLHRRARPRRRPPDAAGQRRGRRQGPLRRHAIRCDPVRRSSPTSAPTSRRTRRASAPVIAAERARWQGARVDLAGRAQGVVGPAPRAGRHDLRRASTSRCSSTVGDERIVIDFRDPRGARGRSRTRTPRYQFSIDRDARRGPRPRARRGLGQRAVPVDALPGAPARARTTTTSTPGSSASTSSGCSTPRASTPSTGRGQGTFEFDGYDVQRRCPHMKADLTRFASDRGRGPDLRPPRLAVGAGDRDVPHLGRAPAATRGRSARGRTTRTAPAEGETAATAGQACRGRQLAVATRRGRAGARPAARRPRTSGRRP